MICSLILTEDEEDACEHPDLDGGESLGLGRVGRDVVEDVDQHEEQRDQQRHPTWKRLRDQGPSMNDDCWGGMEGEWLCPKVDICS